MSHLVIGKRKAISNWFRQFMTIIDLEKKIYKIQESVLGIFKGGTFKPLPKIDYVLVFKQLFAKCEACSIDEYENYEYSYFQVSLVYNKNRRIILHETRDRAEAFSLADNVAASLQTRLKDAATDRRKSTWLR